MMKSKTKTFGLSILLIFSLLFFPHMGMAFICGVIFQFIQVVVFDTFGIFLFIYSEIL
jgi:hypothetical protein